MEELSQRNGFDRFATIVLLFYKWAYFLIGLIIFADAIGNRSISETVAGLIFLLFFFVLQARLKWGRVLFSIIGFCVCLSAIMDFFAPQSAGLDFLLPVFIIGFIQGGFFLSKTAKDYFMEPAHWIVDKKSLGNIIVITLYGLAGGIVSALLAHLNSFITVAAGLVFGLSMALYFKFNKSQMHPRSMSFVFASGLIVLGIGILIFLIEFLGIDQTPSPTSNPGLVGLLLGAFIGTCILVFAFNYLMFSFDRNTKIALIIWGGIFLNIFILQFLPSSSSIGTPFPDYSWPLIIWQTGMAFAFGVAINIGRKVNVDLISQPDAGYIKS